MKNESPLVTIAITTHNDSAYLLRSLSSALEQTYRALEIIVLDDGSNEDEKQRIKEILRTKNNGIVKIFEFEHGGVGKTRNRAISLASGEYLMFLDADDVFSLDYVEQMMKFLLEHQVQVVVSGRTEYLLNGSCIYKGGEEAYVVSKEEAIHNALVLKDNFHINGCKLYSVRFLREQGVKYTEDKLYEDMLFSYNTMCKVSRAGYIPHRGYHYHIREDSLSRGMKDELFIDYVRAILSLLKQAVEVGEYSKNPAIYQAFALQSMYILNLFLSRDEEKKRVDAFFFASKVLTDFIFGFRTGRDFPKCIEEALHSIENFEVRLS